MNKDPYLLHNLLKYMNEAILPWYVLHQTITIILAWYLSRLGMNIGLEATLVVLGTMLGCALGYELVRRWAVGRFLFGLKLKKVKPGSQRSRSAVRATG